MTEFTDFQNKMRDFLPEIDLHFGEPMAKHTSFRIGGPAEVMAFPKSPEELAAVLQAAKQLGVTPAVLGAGTNVLAPDEGLPGLTVCLKDCMDGLEVLDGSRIRAAAGVTMARAAVFAAKHDLGGMEFAHGIPGSIGGGVYMNAGAYGGEICEICCAVEAMDLSGERYRFTGEQMQFSYRHSILEDRAMIVLSAEFQLTPCPSSQVKAKMQELMAKRRASQPLDMPSAGSAFKRPVGGYAAALIDGSGLKGFQVGGAAVSTKHAGFVVNIGGATAADVQKLLKQVSDRVFADSGIRLEPEVRIW